MPPITAMAIGRLVSAPAPSPSAAGSSARMTAAAARVAGLEVVLVLTTTTPTPEIQGNFLLDHLYGAEVELIPAGPDPRLAVAPDEEVRVQACVERLRARGHRPYVIVVGGSSGVGALGYADGTRELVEQLQASGVAPASVPIFEPAKTQDSAVESRLGSNQRAHRNTTDMKEAAQPMPTIVRAAIRSAAS